METQKITVVAVVAADIDQVWNAWTQPEHITRWNFASPDWHCPTAQNDLRDGGKFSSTMASKDGKMSFDFEGTYQKVIDKQHISYTILDNRKVEITFEELAEGIKITETFEAENIHSPELQQAGWQAILNNFKAYVEQ